VGLIFLPIYLSMAIATGLAVYLLWWASTAIARRLGKSRVFAWLFFACSFSVVSMACVSDEIVAHRKLASLCIRDGIRATDLSNAKGQRLYVVEGPKVRIDNVGVETYRWTVSLQKSKDDAPSASYVQYDARPGWFSWTPLGLWVTGGRPGVMVLGPHACDPRDVENVLRSANIIPIHYWEARANWPFARP